MTIFVSCLFYLTLHYKHFCLFLLSLPEHYIIFSSCMVVCQAGRLWLKIAFWISFCIHLGEGEEGKMARKSFSCSGFQESISRSGLTLGYRSVCPSNPDLQASIKEPSPLVGAGSSASSRAEAL